MFMSHLFNRRTVLGSMTALGSLYAAAPLLAQTTKIIRIGYQKSSTLISVLKLQGALEKQLAPLGFQPSWHEFTSGLPLLEALNLNNIDFSADVADTVPVFAQAAGAQLTFVAQEAPSPSAQAILVPKDSPLRAVADLKGKNVGFAKAAGAHYLLIAALAKAGLTLADINARYLTPADGRAAFEKGAIDAWVVWDPFLSAARIQSSARLLADGEGLASYQRYYLSSTRFAEANPKVLDVVYAELERAGLWVKRQPKDAAALLGPFWGLDPAIVEQANGNRSYAVRAVTPERLVEQQKIADAFLAEKLLPKPMDALNVPLFKPTAPSRGARG
ncbi:aliphatic sulfonate ABC transporter substrate-binding protein [Hylemonella gracilis]|uniref:Putative aliphatic sulfonates-binding protein n=1 Tax=Hylemonella gracilis ATCC 19624 TaxID=887062 RepID=F3KR34_9BURK|nr:aliphatic sulfonates family ABC transporter, periplasmic liganD-binding protein [Hylemonella gracilis ATCC 19624]